MSKRTRPDRLGSRVALAVAAAIVCIGLLGAGTPSASAAATGVWEVEHFVRYDNANSTTADVATGDTFRYIVNYTCTIEVCAGGTLSIPFPTGYTVATPSYNTTHLTNLVRTDNSMVFTIAPNIDPGTTGQIDIQASTPGFTTPDGVSFAQSATISTGAQPDAVSANVTVTAHAASNTPVTVTRTAGGAADDIARYNVSVCNASTGAPRTGGLAVLAGSTLTVQLPEGAVVERDGDGTVAGSPPSISWTLDAFNNHGCLERQVTVSYPDSEGSNAVGASKTVTADWNRTLVGPSTETVSGTVTHPLTTRTAAVSTLLNQVTPYRYGNAPIHKVDYGSSATYTTSLSNTGVGTLATAGVAMPIPAALVVQSITARNPGQLDGTVFVTTTCGPDRIAGNGDDEQEEPFATVPAVDDVGPSDLTSAWPNGSAALGSGCVVTDVRVEIGDLWPADGGDVLSVAAQPSNPDRDGAATAYGDDLTVAVSTTGTNTGGTASGSGSVQTEINGPPDPPPADLNTYVTVRHSGPGQLAAGVTQGAAQLNAFIGNLPLVSPVMTVLLPPNVSLVSWSGENEGNGVPTPTLTQTPDFDGNGYTLLAWTFADGVELPVGFGYRVSYTIERNEFGYGNLAMPGYVHAGDADARMACTENYFGSQPDTFDVDGDGNTTEHGCRWDADLSVAAAASANVTTKIKGSFDSGYVAGPATGQTAPASNDNYKVELKNAGTTELDQLVMVDKLPRPGDTKTTSAGARNAATNTFPVVLRGRPTVPTVPTAATLSWSDVTGACQPELGYSPSGCSAPNWRDWETDPPADVADVLLVKVDFGTNILKPGVVWTVDLPVTTPATGPTEPDRADFNPDPVNVPNETAVNTVAFKGQRRDISTALAATEPPGVTLEIPGELGPVGEAPDPAPIETTGTGTQVHTTTVTPPPGGTVRLMDGSTPVDELTVDGVGAYSVDPLTGTMTFEPVLGYSGTADAVTYRVIDAYGQTGDSTWTAEVLDPPGPTASPLTSTGPVRTDQTAVTTVPVGGQVQLLDGSTPTDSVVVAGVGEYVIDPDTGLITFTPESGYRGTPDPIVYRVTDAYGQSSDGSYTPTVSLGALSAEPVSTTGVGTAVHTITVPVPPHDGAVHFLDGSTRVTTITIPGEGYYEIDPSTGVVTFTPELGFSGPGTTLTYERSDSFGQTATSTYTATVAKPAPPSAPNVSSASTPENPSAAQSVTVPPPANTTVTLVDADGNEVTTVTVAGQGTFVLDPVTGTIVFTPVADFARPTSQVAVRITDFYGQAATGSYTAAIGVRPVTRLPVVTGEPGRSPSVVVSVPPGGSIVLVGPDGSTGNSVIIPGEGVYTLDPATGRITFSPEEAFSGAPTPVVYRVTEADGAVSEGTFAPTVLAADADQSGQAGPGAATPGDRTEPSSSPARLAFTGATSANLVLLGAMLLAAGAVLIPARRRRDRAR